MDELYWAVCDVCDIETEVTSIDVEDVPQFCPMCGEETIFTPSSEEDYDN